VRRPGDEFGTRTETKNVNSVRFVMAVVETKPSVRSPSRGRRQDRAGNAPLRPGPQRNARCAARKTRTTTAISPIPICCRWCWTMPSWRMPAPAARTARRQARALRGRSGPDGLCRWRADRRGRHCPLVRGAAGGHRHRAEQARGRCGQAGLQLAALGVRRAEQAGQGSGPARSRRRARVSCWRWSAMARSRARSPSRCSKRCWRPAMARHHRRARRPQADQTPAPSRRRWPPSWPTTPTRWSSIAAGKEALFGFFVGQTMKAMAGKANPQIVNELVKKALA
jgi:aspartyl-tRNA(Asn)/glutamyl-tRNA(Gln) amidotransferase subunit B